MTQRNQIRGALGGHYSSDSCRGNRISLRQRVLLDRVECFERHRYRALCTRGARRLGFSADVHHSRTALGIEVSEVAHFNDVPSSRMSFEVISCGLTLVSVQVCALRTASTALLADAAADVSFLWRASRARSPSSSTS